MEFSNQKIIEYFEESPVQAFIFMLFILACLAILYFIENIPFMKTINEKLYEQKQKLMVSLVVKDNEIQNTNSWSLNNMFLYLLSSYDMV